MAYTDGSCLKTNKQETSCGAAVYIPSTDTAILMNPDGQGLTNTINRAELAGIYGALKWAVPHSEPLHILTDSMSSILQIHKHMKTPQRHQRHIHRPTIQAIVDLLEERHRQGGKTTISKVKAHTGVKGNEMADLHAGRARNEQLCDHKMETNNAAHTGLYWPHKKEENGWRALSGHKDKQIRRVDTSTLTSRPKGIYQAAREAVLKYAVPQSQKYIHNSNVTPAQRRTVMKYWSGTLYNQKIALRLKHSPNDLCPLCHMHDSANHMLGECTHPHIKGLVMQRHNEATRQIAKVLRHSTIKDIQAASIYIDAGKANEDTDLTLLDHKEQPPPTIENTLPTWLLPSTPVGTHRPDILILTNPPKDDNLNTVQLAKRESHIYIMEVGYGPDTRYEITLERKQDQHQELMAALQAEGWSATYLHPIILGVGGTTYTSTIETLRRLGVPMASIKKTMMKIQLNTAHRAQQLVGTRRHLEHCTDKTPFLRFRRGVG